MKKILIILFIVAAGCTSQKTNKKMIFGDRAGFECIGDSIILIYKSPMPHDHIFIQTLMGCIDSKGNDCSDRINRATCIFCDFSCRVFEIDSIKQKHK